MVGVPADEHALETVEGPLEAQEVRMSPPEAVGLPIERQVRVDARVGKEEPALVIHGRAPHGHDQGVVAGPSADRTAQADGIVGDFADRHTGEAGGFPAVRAVAAQRAFQPVFEHPREHGGRGLGEVQLQHLLQHFLLRAAEVGDIAGEEGEAPHQVAAESQHLVHDVDDLLTVAEQIAHIDQTVA